MKYYRDCIHDALYKSDGFKTYKYYAGVYYLFGDNFKKSVSEWCEHDLVKHYIACGDCVELSEEDAFLWIMENQ